MQLKRRLAVAVPGMLAVALAAVVVPGAVDQREEALEDLRARNQGALEAVGSAVAGLLSRNDLAALDALIAQLQEGWGSRELREFAVLDGGGRVLAHADLALFNTAMDDAFSRAAVASDAASWEYGEHELRIAVPARAGLRWATVIARFSLDRLHSQARSRERRWLWSSALALLTIGGFVVLLADHLVVRPLAVFQQSLRRMGEGHWGTRVPDLGGDELRTLAGSANRLAETVRTDLDSLEAQLQSRVKEVSDLNARLERLSVTDGLTGVSNQKRFHDVLRSELLRCERHRRPLALLLVDVDFFKRVNESKGHPAGDELLRSIAEILAQELRQTDLIARFGGEEFSVVLPETTKGEALQVAERMRQAVADRVNEVPRWGQLVTVSIGVATFPEDGPSADRILEGAMGSLLIAKRSGRNRVVSARSGGGGGT
jgi:diguanylate cyclase (GGDEF)-like protein